MVELIIIILLCDAGSLGVMVSTARNKLEPIIGVNVHSKSLLAGSVTVHISSNRSPLQNINDPEGDNITAPVSGKKEKEKVIFNDQISLSGTMHAQLSNHV